MRLRGNRTDGRWFDADYGLYRRELGYGRLDALRVLWRSRRFLRA